MDLIDANLAKTLECPVCLDVFDEPKLLICGHTVCQKCVSKVAKSRLTQPDAWSAGDELKCIKCPECGKETEIPPEGLATNYRLVDLVCRAQQPLVDAYACYGCGKQTPVADMFTCDTCQETLKHKPLWFCALCVVRQHHDHAVAECNKATRMQIHEACQGVSSSGSLADMYIGLTMSHLNGALEKNEVISQLLNQRRRGFSTIEERIKRADDNLTQEDLAASLQKATDLKQKFEKASTIANQAGKDLESVLQTFHGELKELLPNEAMDEADTNGDSQISDVQESFAELAKQKCLEPPNDHSTDSEDSLKSMAESRRLDAPPLQDNSANAAAPNPPQTACFTLPSGTCLLANGRPCPVHSTPQANNSSNFLAPSSFATTPLGTMRLQPTPPHYDMDAATISALRSSGSLNCTAGWYH